MPSGSQNVKKSLINYLVNQQKGFIKKTKGVLIIIFRQEELMVFC